MYRVQNVTKSEIVIGDLHLSLSPGKSIDLDMIQNRKIVDQSKSLSIAISRGLLKVIVRDGFITSSPLIQSPVIPLKEEKEPVLDALKEMEKRLTEKFNAQIDKRVSQKEVPPADASGISEAVDALNKLINNISTNNTHGNLSNNKPQLKNDEQDDEFDSKMVDIHTRSVNRMTKKTEGNLKQEGTKGRSTFSQNINELEDFI